MLNRVALCASLLVVLAGSMAQAFDDAKYPDVSGQWLRVNFRSGGQPSFDQTKPWGLGQGAPLTPEYQAILEASIADQANGGQGNWNSSARCLPPGMPATMNGYNSLEFVVLPEITYVLVEHNLPIQRRIYTDGRDWPAEVEPTFQGYSIGRWIESDGKGRFDVLEAETRFFKGPRSLDPTGIPVHADNQSIVKERFFFDKADPKLLHDELTLIDHALTRPWTVLKTYFRNPNPRPVWREENCPGVTRLIKIGKEVYFKGADDTLLPTRKDQPPPDLRYFKKAER
ncbi:MAG TPA: hypothetical protein VKW08_23925 [Xanthobacteraceae bacterium]|nr:hypothetical protein [Xanthobacteraceae bacterium]